MQRYDPSMNPTDRYPDDDAPLPTRVRRGGPTAPGICALLVAVLALGIAFT